MTTLTSELPGCHRFLYQRREVPGSPAACKTMSSPAVAITSEGHSVRLPDCPVSGNSNHSTMCLKQRQWQIHQGFRMGLRETAENRMRPQGRPRGTRRDVCPPGYQVLHVTEARQTSAAGAGLVYRDTIKALATASQDVACWQNACVAALSL